METPKKQDIDAPDVSIRIKPKRPRFKAGAEIGTVVCVTILDQDGKDEAATITISA
jgi:hypothetical protein